MLCTLMMQPMSLGSSIQLREYIGNHFSAGLMPDPDKIQWLLSGLTDQHVASAELKLPFQWPPKTMSQFLGGFFVSCFSCSFFNYIFNCAVPRALTSQAFYTGADLAGIWHRASLCTGTDWVYFQLTSIYLPVITLSWLFALASRLQIALVLSKGLTQAFWIPYQISSTTLVVNLSPDPYRHCL